MVLGKSRQAHQRTQSFLYAKWYWVNHGRLTSEQSCTRTLDRQRTIMHSNTRQALSASTRSVYAKWYWVNHGRLTSEQQAHQRTQSLPSATHRHSSITRPCCSIAQAPSFLSFTRRRTDAFATRRRGNHIVSALEHSNTSSSAKLLVSALEHSNTKWYWVNHGRTIMHSNINHGRLTSEQSCTRTLEHEMVLGKSRQDNHALEHSTG